MPNIKQWIKAFRFRTLPLSLSSILVGNALGWSSGSHPWSILILSLLTTLCLQILSNLANDLGDTLKGVDNSNRVGPIRTVQSGSISIPAMKRMIIVFIFLALAAGTALVVVSFRTNHLVAGETNPLGLYVISALGLLAIAAALLYTLGKRPYGYLGLGDFFVFVFFGIVGVVGTYFLHSHSVSPSVFLPAIAIGLLSTGVLNCNNVRDAENDKQHHKITIPVRIGLQASIAYQYTLVLGAWCCMILFGIYYTPCTWINIIYLSLPLFIIHLRVFITAKTRKEYDPELKRLSLSTFALAVLFSIGYLI